MRLRSRSGFSLIELSVVLMVLSLLAAAAGRYSANMTNTANVEALNNTLDTIELALQNYGNTFSRLPCPAMLINAENVTGFGNEVDSFGIGAGKCFGGSKLNSSDPDNDPDKIANDPKYDSATAGKIAAGQVPTKTLRLEDRFAYDPWGRKLLFVVDARITATNAFNLYEVNNEVIGGVVIKNTSSNTLANANTYKAVYAIISFGPDGHGAYVRNIEQNAAVFSSGNTNSDTQKNCHCDSGGTATTFDRIFIQKNKTDSSSVLTDSFDDVVRYKSRSQMANFNQLQ